MPGVLTLGSLPASPGSPAAAGPPTAARSSASTLAAALLARLGPRVRIRFESRRDDSVELFLEQGFDASQQSQLIDAYERNG
jgi:hypothetical protein